jgi:AmmeMemoRadiSam system protein A
MNDVEGEHAVRIARKTIEAEAKDEEPGQIDAPGSFREKRGVFVTIHTYPEMCLRGCIGYPEPVYSLGKALVKAAQGACHDPRFPYLRADELAKVVVEVSILTPPEEIKIADRKQLPSVIEVGKDGLIMETFLAETCCKAGLTPECWLDKRSKVFKFQAEVFAERGPNGKVSRKALE